MSDEFIVVDQKDAHIHVCACGKKFDWHAETIEQALAAQRQALRDEVLSAIGDDESVPSEIAKYGSVGGEIAVDRNELRAELRTAISTIFEGKE